MIAVVPNRVPGRNSQGTRAIHKQLGNVGWSWHIQFLGGWLLMDTVDQYCSK